MFEFQFTPDRFPIFVANYTKDSERRMKWISDALQTVQDGLDNQAVRNVPFKDAKSHLNDAANEAWHEAVVIPFMHKDSGKEISGLVRNELYYNTTIMSVHDIRALPKRLDRLEKKSDELTDDDRAMIKAARDFLKEAWPLYEAFNTLKPLIVKGRAPRETPAPVNPNKVVKTCQCCVRAIAVVDGLMAHHGYRRPGDGWQTASCQGIRYQPLEVANDGLIDMLDGLQEGIKKTRELLFDLPDRTEILVYNQRENRNRKIEKATATPMEWRRHMEGIKEEYLANLRGMRRAAADVVKRIEDWKPEDPANCKDSRTPELMARIASPEFRSEVIEADDREGYKAHLREREAQQPTGGGSPVEAPRTRRMKP